MSKLGADKTSKPYHSASGELLINDADEQFLIIPRPLDMIWHFWEFRIELLPYAVAGCHQLNREAVIADLLDMAQALGEY